MASSINTSCGMNRFFIYAIQNDQEEEAIKVLQTGTVDLHTPDKTYGYPALHLAVFYGRVSVVGYILELENNGVNDNRGKRIKKTPLMIAIEKKFAKIACMLIRKMDEDSIDRPSSLGVKPLALAFQNEQYEIVRQLISSNPINRGNQRYLISVIIKDKLIVPMPIITALSIKLDFCKKLNHVASSKLNTEAEERLIFFKTEVQRFNFNLQATLNEVLQGVVPKNEGVDDLVNIIYEYL